MEKQENIKEFLKKFQCKGCYNHCPLSNPNCNKSKIFIKEILKKLEEGT